MEQPAAPAAAGPQAPVPHAQDLTLRGYITEVTRMHSGVCIALWTGTIMKRPVLANKGHWQQAEGWYVGQYVQFKQSLEGDNTPRQLPHTNEDVLVQRSGVVLQVQVPV